MKVYVWISTTCWPSVRCVLVKYRTDILLVQNEQARLITEIYLTSAKVQNDRRACSSVVISYSISLPTSLYMVTFPFLIIYNTLSLHILSKTLILILHKQGFLKSPPPPERTIREISGRLWTNQIAGFPYSDRSLPQPYNKFTYDSLQFVLDALVSLTHIPRCQSQDRKSYVKTTVENRP